MNARVGDAAAIDRRRFLGSVARAGAGGLLLRGAAGAAGLTAVTATSASAAPSRNDVAGFDGLVLDDWYRTLYNGAMDEPEVNGSPTMTPGRAARMYAYCAVAAYEAVQPGTGHLRSLAGQLNGLRPVPAPASNGNSDWPLRASAAIHTVAAWVFRNLHPNSRAAIAAQLQTHIDQRRAAGVSQKDVDRSLLLGKAVGDHIVAWASEDGAEATYTTPHTPPSGQPWLWKSTFPRFGPAIDPYWGSVRTMALPSAGFCKPSAPIAFGTDPSSAFWAQAQAVIDAVAAGANDPAEQAIAFYWRDNPVTSGLPSGHWMRLVSQLNLDRGLSLDRAAEALAMAGITLHDAFVSCWHEKYQTNLLRPITYIREVMGTTAGRTHLATWQSPVNTPQFPEYTSGHSVASQATATVLTKVLGTFAFTDRTHTLRNPSLGSRTYGSFQEAASEAARSRLIGGIHYPMGIEVGLSQGQQVGQTVLARVRTR